MAGKAAIQTPIDRPLSRAYLRKFAGWSTAYPPGASDSASLRVMHNCSIASDNSLAIRPGLRHAFSSPAKGPIIGDLEHFYTADGKKALLFAYRGSTTKVGFQTATYNSATDLYEPDASLSTNFPDGGGTSGLPFESSCTNVTYVQIDNKILALSDNDESFRMFWVGEERKVKEIQSVSVPYYWYAHRPTITFPTTSWVAGSQTTLPTSYTPTTSTLRSSTSGDNIYYFAYWYTFNNEIGEGKPSRVIQTKVQRRFSAWEYDSADDSKSDDQIVIKVPEMAWDIAVAEKAVSWNLYMMTWSNQDSVPSEGVLIATTEMTDGSGAYLSRDLAAWAAHTPMIEAQDVLSPLPDGNNRYNYTTPSTAARGLVAGDRLVLVGDTDNAARIRWTSNQQGDYLNFSSSKGGGYKTLTSGNLFLPEAIVLWQNPSSVDTITILNSSIDGAGNAYYMNANTTVTTQSQSTTIMGFEETTATQGTVAPNACMVLNNALYHVTNNDLVKSTASNYNISHKPMAGAIQNIWRQVKSSDKQRMAGAQMDNTLYYLVQSPLGWLDGEGYNGNQVWTMNTAISDVWSCWDVEGSSLRKLELGGLQYMSIARGDSLFIFDPEYDNDDYWDGTGWDVEGIAWEAVTNTQGANRAHDAWAHLQQLEVTFGNFTGECVYGVRGVDLNGKIVEVEKHYISPETGHSPFDRFDQSDTMLVRRGMRAWEFFWRSADRPKVRSYGSVSYVQYRYTPLSVNIGYEMGTVESFEYGSQPEMFSNGVPTPFADVIKP